MSGANSTNLLFVDAAINAWEANKKLADKAVAQTSDANLRRALDENTNSIAVIMKHVAGNLISRWTDFLTTDGEKPWRNRDDEFVDAFAGREEIEAYWEKGWGVLYGSLRSLTEEDLSRTVVIRGEPHSVHKAMQRSLAHTTYHIGQIVMIARILAGDRWDTLSIVRGGSQQYNAENWGGAGNSRP